MKTQRQHILALLMSSGLFILLGFAGCNKDDDDNATQPAPSASDQGDIAEDFGSALANGDEGMLRSWQDGGGGFHFTEGNRGRSLDDTLIVEHDGFTLVKIRNFFDVNNVWSEFYIPDISARMEQTVSLIGTHESNSGNRIVSVEAYDTLSVDGLLPIFTVWTLNGNGERGAEGEFHSRFHQNVRTFESHYIWSLDELQISTNVEENPYPLDGILTVRGYWINTHTNPGRDVSTSVRFSFVVHFDGTRYAQLMFSGGGVFWIDLANGWCWRERPGDEE